MNRQSILIFLIVFVTSLLFVNADTADSAEKVGVRSIRPELVKVKKVSAKKLIVEVAWNVTDKVGDYDQYLSKKGITKLSCKPSGIVTIRNSHQKHLVGDFKTTYKLDVHKKNTV
ncbi:12350_t:CDS:2, partial [Dentiscutata heterogama]